MKAFTFSVITITHSLDDEKNAHLKIRLESHIFSNWATMSVRNFS